MHFLEHLASFGDSDFVKVINCRIGYNLCRPICITKYRFIKNCRHTLSSHLYKRVFDSLPCFVVGKYRTFGQVFRNMDYPNFTICIIRDKLFDVQSFGGKIGASFSKTKNRFLPIVIISVSSNNFQCLVVNTNHQMSTFHIGNGRYIRNHIVFLVSTKRVLQIFIFLPFAMSILLWVVAKEVLL